MRSKIFLFIALVLSSLLGCKSALENEAPLLQRLSSSQTGIDFANHISHSDSLIALSFEYLYNGCGVGVGDFNRDGLPDLFFTGNQEMSRLYYNNGELSFSDMTDASSIHTSGKWAIGVSIADVNQDGWDDIYICVGGLDEDATARSNLLYINQQNGTFAEKAEAYNLADAGYSIHSLFYDYDHDGDLDAYILTTALDPYSWTEYRPRRINGEASNTDKLYRNNGDETYTDISKEAGITIEGYGLGIAMIDINNDGWEDLYIANDFLSNDVLYVNDGTGHYEDQINLYFDHLSRNSMGIDAQDINNDGAIDLMVLDMLPKSNARQKSMFGFFNYDKFQLGLQQGYLPQYPRNTLQLNNGNGSFSEVGQLAGIDRTDWSWATLMTDLDNDGWQDIFITNGYRQDITNMDFATYSRQLTSSPVGSYESKEKQMFEKLRTMPEIKMENYLFQNTGTLKFEDVSKKWGIDLKSYSNGAVYVDLDNDGDQDLVVNNIDDEAFVYENTLSERNELKHNYLRISLDNGKKTAIGSKVTLYHDGAQKTTMLYASRGYLSSVEKVIHFGLGDIERLGLDSLVIVWPDGQKQKEINIPINEDLIIKNKIENHDQTLNPNRELAGKNATIFSDVTNQLIDSIVHLENDFVDFKVQPILPHKHSQGGPFISVGDINNDGLSDFYVGGSDGYFGQLGITNNNGSFDIKPFLLDSQYYDMESIIFDADGDGDHDLYVVSGGSQFQEATSLYQDRLYENDGLGNFQRTNGLPKIISSGSVVTHADFDGDGDLDLFIGGRVMPGAYPTFPQSYLLENKSTINQIKFIDISALLPDNGRLGMVTDAAWMDKNKDGKMDLVVVGEFMPITFLIQEKTSFTLEKIKDTEGWWNTVELADLDNDGDMDIVAGNLGLNGPYKASTKEPVEMYAKDFDKNGRVDPVLTHFIEGEKYIAHSRDMLIKQINAMRSRFKTYTQYGQTTFEKSFTKAEISDAQRLKVVDFSSAWFENMDDGSFIKHHLPLNAQIGPINSITTSDVNGDGILDLIAVGNSYCTEIMVGQYDAMKGLVLLGKKDKKFIPAPVSQSGFFAEGDVKDLKTMKTEDGQLYLVSKNRGLLSILSTTKQPYENKDILE